MSISEGMCVILIKGKIDSVPLYYYNYTVLLIAIKLPGLYLWGTSGGALPPP